MPIKVIQEDEISGEEDFYGKGEEEFGEKEEEEEEDEEDEDEDDESLPPPPPPEGEEKELLFLMEFLVESLKLFPEHMNLENIDPCCLQGPTTVILTFLHFPPMKMNEKDLDTNRRTGENFIMYNVGKSLIFALTESQFEEPPPIFLGLSASKDMPHAFRFPSLNIGKTKIELSELFKQVFDKFVQTPTKTVSKSIKDTYQLMGEKNAVGGEISLYMRLTCIGENIVTEFKKADDPNEATLYKNIDSEKIYVCKETVGTTEHSPATKVPGWGDGSGRNCQKDNVIKTYAPDPYDEKCEEIFADINGSAITIKVEKNKRKEHKEFHISEFCDCNIPLPENLVAGMSDLSLSPVTEGIKIGASDLPPRDPRVGLDSANNLVFHIPPVEALALPGGKNSVIYNVKTCQQGTCHGHDMKSFKIIKDNPNSPPPVLPNDPDKDVFILRIIKRGKLERGKGSLELEFKTPKEKIELPKRKPYMVDHCSLTEAKKRREKKKKKKKA